MFFLYQNHQPNLEAFKHEGKRMVFLDQAKFQLESKILSKIQCCTVQREARNNKNMYFCTIRQTSARVSVLRVEIENEISEGFSRELRKRMRVLKEFFES